MSEKIDRRKFLEKILISGTGMTLAPHLLASSFGQDIPKPRMIDGIMQGGYYFDEEAQIF